MDTPKPQSREDLISYISTHLTDIRKEAGISQAQLAKILGISKNSIVNAEKNSGNMKEDEPYNLSWSVVMSIMVLFQHLEIIQEILKKEEGGEESALEMISRFAFLEEDASGKNKLLYTTLLSTTLGLTAGLVAAPGLGLSLLGIINGLLNDKPANHDKKK